MKMDKKLARVFGLTIVKELAYYAQDSQLWKTLEHSFLTESTKYLGRFPKSGMMLSGRLYQLQTLALHTEGREYGLLPTPVSSDATTGGIIGKNDTFYMTSSGMPRKVNQNGKDGSVGLARYIKLLPTPCARDWKGAQANEYKQFRGEEAPMKMESLPGLAMRGLLLRTPSVNMEKHGNKFQESFNSNSQTGTKQIISTEMINHQTGLKLEPELPEWMMGYPQGWSDLNESISLSLIESKD